MPLTLAHVDCERIIELVHQYDELYNWNHPRYSDVVRRDQIWVEIAKIMQKPG